MKQVLLTLAIGVFAPALTTGAAARRVRRGMMATVIGHLPARRGIDQGERPVPSRTDQGISPATGRLPSADRPRAPRGRASK